MVWGAVAGAAIGMAGSLYGGSKADAAARSAAREQSKLVKSRRTEELRQTKMEQGGRRSAMRAGVAASNLQATGTSASYLKTQVHEDMRQVAWTERANQLEQRAIRKGAQGAGDAMRIAGVSNALSTAVSAAVSSWE